MYMAMVMTAVVITKRQPRVNGTNASRGTRRFISVGKKSNAADVTGKTTLVQEVTRHNSQITTPPTDAVKCIRTDFGKRPA